MIDFNFILLNIYSLTIISYRMLLLLHSSYKDCDGGYGVVVEGFQKKKIGKLWVLVLKLACAIFEISFLPTCVYQMMWLWCGYVLSLSLQAHHYYSRRAPRHKAQPPRLSVERRGADGKARLRRAPSSRRNRRKKPTGAGFIMWAGPISAPFCGNSVTGGGAGKGHQHRVDHLLLLL
uniref:Uncharacterized protein n=1 Tax=Cucumis melo TaxID=3656 RepID=A0A9I9ELJ8_CUCME